ncbi:putative transporter [mine drainage metagenome]|uniref:Putative transporter n=1 Tax=mine drainage metagenome TaxID=410659 RepID=A0A1J5QBR5_9ZZZZ
MTHAEWPPAVRMVLGARVARSVGQGALVVGFTLYLHALGWRAGAIGGVLSAALLLGVVLTVFVGPLSDRVGRRRFLLGYELLVVLSALLALCSAQPWALVVGAMIGGFGRGANGAAGPFGPLEQAWLAHDLAPRQRTRVFNLNATLGFGGMAAGALLAALAPSWRGVLPGALAYRPLFALPLLGSLIGFALLWRAPEAPRVAAPGAQARAGDESPRTRAAENRLLAALALANALNGLGIGLVAPLMAYWFALRFGHGPASIGPALAAGFVLAAAGAQLAQRVAARLGAVRTVLAMRGAGLVLLLLTPWLPWFTLAAGAWALRAAFNQGTIGVRQALALGLTGPQRRGLAATVNNVSMMVPRSIGPALAGLLLARGWLVAPFVAAAACQFAYLLAYRAFFGDLPGAS